MEYIVYARYVQKFVDTACPNRGTWFWKLVRGSKLIMGLITKQNFGLPCEAMKALLTGLEVYRNE